MANLQLVTYIKTQLAAGVVEPEIQKALVASGWSIGDISAAFIEAKAPTPPPASVPVLAPKPAAPLQPTSPQPISTTTMQMNVQGTPARRWGLVITVVAILLLVGAAAATYMFVPMVKDMVGYYLGSTPAPVQEVATTTPNVQTDAANGYSVVLPESNTLVPISVYQETFMDEEIATSSLPAGSMQAVGLFIASKIFPSDIASGEEIYDYAGCCTGVRYWFDASSTAFKAESILFANDKTTYKPAPLATTTPSGTECTLARRIGPHTFYRITSGDEQVATRYYYFLPTDQGYMLRFMTTADLDQGGAEIATALASLTLTQGSATTVQCQ